MPGKLLSVRIYPQSSSLDWHSTPLFRIWWADFLAALVMVPMIAREGIGAWRDKACRGACGGST
jgi:hypothetical protein